jgi:uncharacterized protein DUF6879
VRLIQGGIDLPSLLQGFRVSAFRLEVQQFYDNPKEREWFERWKQTGEVPSFTPDNDPWCKLVANGVSVGQTIQRVHAVYEPLTPYLRFEFQCQLASVEVGEDVRVIVVTTENDPLNFDEDFWLFDNETVVELAYDPEGRFAGAYEPGLDLGHYLTTRDDCMQRSIPLKEFLAR